MAAVTQLPGVVDFAFRRSDEFGTTFSFDTSLDAATVTSSIVSAVTGSAVASFGVSKLGGGQVSIGLTEAQTGSLAVGTYIWRMIWNQAGDVQRTVLGGTVEVTA